MNLADFSEEGPIFVDANVFIYHLLDHPSFGEHCTAFLEKIESGRVLAYTSSLVIDEVYYAILISKGTEILQTKQIKVVQRRLKTDRELVELCYNEVLVFQNYLDALEERSLVIADVTSKTLRGSIEIAKRHLLLPRDAVHLSTCKEFGIRHIASNDADFERVDFVSLWRP